MNSKTLLIKPYRIIPSWLLIALIAVAVTGFGDATYLTVKHYGNSAITCAIGEGCETVTTSKYSTLFGFPISLFGALYYLTILLLLIAYFDTRKTGLLKMAARFSVIGFLVSLGLVSLQVFVIRAICFYCMISAASSTVIFILGMMALDKIKKENSRHSERSIAE